MLNNIEKNIIKHIILAQIASDGGKGIKTLSSFKGSKKASLEGYNVKDKHILSAIKIINSTPRCSVNYYVIESPDQNGYDSLIIYFDIKINNERYQISFHSPKNRTILLSNKNKGRKTRWTGGYGGSREACYKLAELL